MEYIGAILANVGPIIAEAQKSTLGLASLFVLMLTGLASIFLFLTARKQPILGLVLLISLLVMSGVAIGGLVLSVDIAKPPIVYTVDMLQRLQNVDFKTPYYDEKSLNYALLDARLERQSGDTWHEIQERPDRSRITYEHKQTGIRPARIDFQRPNVELFIDFSKRLICYRETTLATVPPVGTGAYWCPYALVSFE